MLRATANGWLDLVICNWDGQKDLPYRNLGDATIAERVIIEWLSGNVTQLTDQAVNQTLSITETVSITPARPHSRSPCKGSEPSPQGERTAAA